MTSSPLKQMQNYYLQYANTHKLLGSSVIFVIGVVAGAAAFGSDQPIVRGNLHGYMTNVFTEALGVAFTVLVLNGFARRREKSNRRRELFSQILSRSNDFAVDAVRQLRDNGWFHLSVADKARLKDVQWQGADLDKVNLCEVNLRKANLEEANLTQTNLEAANLSDAILRKATLMRANLRKATLVNVGLQWANLGQAHLQGANLNRADLQHADLWRCQLQAAKMEETDLNTCNLSEANLQAAQLDRANLRGANLFGANLLEADLARANLQAANLSEVNLLDADLEGVVFDQMTVLPDAVRVRDTNDKFAQDAEGNWVYDKYWTPDTDMRRYTDSTHPDFWQPVWAMAGHMSYWEWVLAR